MATPKSSHVDRNFNYKPSSLRYRTIFGKEIAMVFKKLRCFVLANGGSVCPQKSHIFFATKYMELHVTSWLSFYFCSHYSSGKADFRVGISSQTLPDLQHHFATSCDMARYGGLVSAFCGPRSTPLQVKAHSQPAPGGIRSHSRMTAILRRCMRRKLCWSSMARLHSVWLSG